MTDTKHTFHSSGFKDRLLKEIKSLSQSERELFERIFQVWETKGELIPPTEMIPWIEQNIGHVDSVTVQDFIKITNTIMYEGAIFNDLRTQRPITMDSNFTEMMAQIDSAKGGPFESPLTGTPSDTFGRIKGEYCITASNLLKYDGLHGLIIFNDHNPLLFTRERMRDYFTVAKKWFKKAYLSNKKAIYPVYTWNCLWRAGASIIHGHSQLALTEGRAYAKIEQLRYLSLRYQEKYRTNYFDDLYSIHQSLGLGIKVGNIRLITKLTPIKEKEVMIMADNFDDELADRISDVLNVYKEKLEMLSFNLSIILPPMEKTPEVWEHVQVIVRIVDRGKLSVRSTDFASMELYCESVIESNQYVVIEEIKKALLRNSNN